MKIFTIGVVSILGLLMTASVTFAGGAAARVKGQGDAMRQRQQAAQQQVQMQKRQQEIQQLQLQQQAKTSSIDERAVDEVGLPEMMNALRDSSRDWKLVIDLPAKEMIVAGFIDEYRREGVGINKPPMFYAQMIDAMSAQSPEMLDQPFAAILRVAAILEYDFHNGQNPDTLALQILGTPAAVEQNKSRFRQR